MSAARSTRGRAAVRAASVGIVALLVAQSAAHLTVALGFDSYDSLFDLDRSNGVADVISVAIILSGALGAAMLATRVPSVRLRATALAIALTLIAIDDALHQDVALTTSGRVVVVTLVAAVLLAISVAVVAPRPARIAVFASIALLAIDIRIPFAYDQLMNATGNSALVRGDLLYEIGVVLDEGTEVTAWVLLAIGLWVAALAKPEVAPGPSRGLLHSSR